MWPGERKLNGKKTYYVKDGEKYWRVNCPEGTNVRDVLRDDLKDTEILSEKEFDKKLRRIESK